MLRHAIVTAPEGAVITFDAALNGQTIRLAARSPGRPIEIARNVTIQGPGDKLLTISGENRGRIFVISGGSVRISGVTLANGLARGGDGGSGTGGGGGGGGSAGMGGAIYQKAGSLTLSGVTFNGNRAIGGNGGHPGGSLAIGNGGAGGDTATGDGPASAASGTSDRWKSSNIEIDGRGGAGGTSETAAVAGTSGGFGAGGGGGGCALLENGRVGGPGGANGFGGGAGGAGASLDPEGVGADAGGGAGGAGLGGAIFVSSGQLRLIDTVFVNNQSIGGLGAAKAGNGPAKGGALFLCSIELCGTRHEALAVWEGHSAFHGNSAGAGPDQSCPGRDDPDVCGRLASATIARFAIGGPLAIAPGVPFTVIVTALDANDIPVFTYSGQVRLTSSDPNSILPGEVRLSGGGGAFPVTLKTVGNQTITVAESDGTAVRGTSRPIAVTSD